MSAQRFETTLQQADTWTYIEIPFDPDAAWGAKEIHHVSVTMNDDRTMGRLEGRGDGYCFTVGAGWLQKTESKAGDRVEVVMEPNGPQMDSLPPDLAAALNDDPEAKAFFESLAPFYRRNLVRRIESAKRPETRARNIAASMESLREGRKPR